jgi:hypothetical protein
MSLRLLATIVPAVLSTLATAVGIVLFALSPRESAPIELRAENTYPLIAMQLSLLTVGAAIAWRHRANPIGWLLSATGLAAGLVYLAGGYATYGMLSTNRLPSADVVAWLFSWAKLAMGLSLPPIFFLFPDGQLRSRRDRIGLVTGLTAVLLGVGVLAFSPGPLLGILFVQNPYGWNAGEAALKLAFAVACVLGFVFLFLGTISLRARYRGASGLERQQLKWLYGAAGLYVVTLVVILPPYLAEWLGIPVEALIRYLANLIGGLAYTIFPIAIGIAILRHRLYDIDVLINRTLVYGATTATLLGLYAVIVLVALALLRPLTQGSELAVAVSTLAVASLIQPVRRRVQRGVDRRFYRSRYDAARTLEAFGTRLRDEVDIDALRHELVAVVHDTMEPAHASLWLRPQ